MNFKNKKQNLTSLELNTFEEGLEGKLPKAYKNHILKNNGGSPTLSYHKTRKIQYFHSIKYGEFGTLEKTLTRLKDILPKAFLPFAYDGGGNQFCLSLNKDGYGKIYFCPLDMGDIIPELLANSFEEFMSGLTAEDNY